MNISTITDNYFSTRLGESMNSALGSAICSTLAYSMYRNPKKALAGIMLGPLITKIGGEEFVKGAMGLMAMSAMYKYPKALLVGAQTYIYTDFAKFLYENSSYFATLVDITKSGGILTVGISCGLVCHAAYNNPKTFAVGAMLMTALASPKFAVCGLSSFALHSLFIASNLMVAVHANREINENCADTDLIPDMIPEDQTQAEKQLTAKELQTISDVAIKIKLTAKELQTISDVAVKIKEAELELKTAIEEEAEANSNAVNNDNSEIKEAEANSNTVNDSNSMIEDADMFGTTDSN